MITRRSLLPILGGGLAAASYPCYIEPRWLDANVRHVAITRVRLPHPVRILHLADLHASVFVPLDLIDSAITAGLAMRPDLICVTGDFITFCDDFSFEDYARTLSRLSKAAPTFAVLGNHDGGPWSAKHRGNPDSKMVEALLENSGIRLLRNESERVRVSDLSLSLAGTPDLWQEKIDPRRTFADVHETEPVVLLAHNPDTKDVVAKYPWDLMLSGHTHGGQVVLPGLGVCFAPVNDWRYIAGLVPWGERQVHVTRGVGNFGGVRFQCRPEVNLLELRTPTGSSV